jgi:hypothetical protein
VRGRPCQVLSPAHLDRYQRLWTRYFQVRHLACSKRALAILSQRVWSSSVFDAPSCRSKRWSRARRHIAALSGRARGSVGIFTPPRTLRRARGRAARAREEVAPGTREADWTTSECANPWQPQLPTAGMLFVFLRRLETHQRTQGDRPCRARPSRRAVTKGTA